MECVFASTLPPIFVTSIIADPARRSQSFLLLGTANSPSRGVLVHLNFSNLHEADCTAQDYEQWTPFDKQGPSQWQNCVMGETITYTRRKQNSTCFNANNEYSTKPIPCPCTPEDYEW